LLAMSRYLGVRVPSEPFSMTWDYVDWERMRIRIPSPKTEVHGKSFRIVPILPEVKPLLERAFDEAKEGSMYVFENLRSRDSVKKAEKGFWGSVNLRQQLQRMLKRGGIKPWPRLWHNLRSSAQTDLANQLPIHVVCEWLGNSRIVAQDHYLQITEEHFAKASGNAAQKAAQSGSETVRNDVNVKCIEVSNPSKIQLVSQDCEVMHKCGVGDTGFEPVTSSV
jgi:integrase